MGLFLLESSTKLRRQIARALCATGVVALVAVLSAATPPTASAVECAAIGAVGLPADDGGLGGNTACGANADATGSRGTAYGASTNASNTDSTAIGNNSKALGIDSTAVGSFTNATETNASAFGRGAQATAPNSVALGAGSIADAPDTVSVGSPGNERRITNIAPATLGTDAVNLNQLHSQLDSTRDELRSGIAAAVSLVTLTPSGPGRTVVNVGWGYYKSENAIGMTVNHRLKIWEDSDLLEGTLMMINAGVGYGIGEDPVVRAGASFEF